MSINVESKVSGFLTLSKMDEIAKSIGYNFEGDFLQGEFDSLVLEATDVALRHLDPSKYEPVLRKVLTQAVQLHVKEQFAKVCRVQENTGFPELDLPGTWRHGLHIWCHSLCF